MILHKENTLRAEPFYKSLNNLSLFEIEKDETDNDSNDLKLLEKYSYFIQNLMTFEKEIKNDTNIKILMVRFLKYLKGIIPIKDFSLMLYDEIRKELSAIDKSNDSTIAKTMNQFNNEGIFKAIFIDKKTLTVPELDSYKSEGPRLFYLVFPVYDENKNYGIFAVLTSLNQESISEFDKKSINIFLNLFLGKLEKLKLTEQLNETYEELQTYQAKLANDFRLSSIGEMTEGIVEDIISPLQVMSSNVDILISETENKSELTQIKSQINKINNVVGRLVKFADINQNDIKIQPCNLNEIIKEYFYLVKSTLENANLEYILDFEKDLPSILSHPNLIYQLLTNIFSLIKSYKTKKGGIIIQTRYKKKEIILRVISTNKIDNPNKKNNENVQQDLSISIIKNLMKKHEGQLEFDTFQNSGAALVLMFPLIRKIRK